ncbi:Bacterial membrane flanked domain protein [Brevibacterium ravenspurgense]|uniref:Bacterial membrane flanked domain protein n=2 Tax=Brevibacterium ravenspurgense TaxID=479117 RepID=A0A150H8S5_9MICO|nr:Bacterial membrane flanked domain protein [Brevibacterium ravenspurgense]
MAAPQKRLEPGVWHRVHPMTPVMQMGGFLVAAFFGIVIFAGNLLPNLIGTIFTGGGALREGSEAIGRVPVMYFLLPLLGIFVIVAAGVGLLYLQWKKTAYRYDDRVVEFKHGIVAKAHRHANFLRIQSVDVQQPFLARILGLATLVFDVAGGSDSNITILYLKKAQAEQLRDIILANVRTAKAAAAPAGPADSLPGAAPTHPNQTAPAAGYAGGQVSGTSSDAGQHGHPGLQNQPGQPRHRGRDASGTQHNPDAPGMPAGAKIVSALSGHAEGVGNDLAGSFQELIAPYTRSGRIKPDGELVRVPLHRTILAAFLSTGVFISLALILLAIAAIGVCIALAVGGYMNIEALFAVLTTMAPMAFGFVIATFQMVTTNLKHGNFSAKLTGDGVQISQGVFSTERVLVPLDRLQAVEIRQPFMWRIAGWYRVMFNTAGDSGKEGKTLLPVGSLTDVQTLMGLVLPEGVGELNSGHAVAPGDVVHEALAGTFRKPAGVPGLFAQQPGRTRWLDPLNRARAGWAVTKAVMAVRTGRFTRRAIFVPHARVQSLGWNQGPIQRSFKVATIYLHSTRGPVRPYLEHLDEHTARKLLFDYAQHTQRARAAMDAA